MLHLGLAAVLLAQLPLTASEPGPPAPIYGGAPAPPGAWPEVVALLLPFGNLCTGTLVHERLVLTAAHCLVFGTSADQLRVRLGDDVTFPGAPTHAVLRFGAHPDYCADLTICKQDNWDLGYVLLAEPILDVAPARPLRTQDAWDEAMAVGDPVTLVGFGEDEKGLTSIKREVVAPIVRLSATGLEFQAGGMGIDTCSGDSGGPAFVTLASGEVLLAGVTSRGSKECGNGGVYGIPSAVLCWLHDETGIDLREGTCATCDCLDTAPDDDDGCGGCSASDPLGPLAALLFALPRRRRPR